MLNELKVELLGFWPRYAIKDEELKTKFEKDYFGADYLISNLQKAVSQAVSFGEGLEAEILKSFNEKTSDKDYIFKKLASSLLRGHSLDGTSGIVLGIDGTKLLDSSLTGLVISRSFVTSGRRAKIDEANIVVPKVLNDFEELKKEYLETSKSAIDIYKKIVDTFGEKDGPQIASKAIPYNNPGNLYIVLPLSSIVTISYELEHQKEQGQVFFPREIEDLISIIENDVLPSTDMKIMYEMRKAALRDTYLHWNIFKKPEENLATEIAEEFGNPLDPCVVDLKIKYTEGFIRNIRYIEGLLMTTYRQRDPIAIERAGRLNLFLLREFAEKYNDALSLQTISSLSWRVWSEQKRHATLKQHVESIYMAADRAHEIIAPLWQDINDIHCKRDINNPRLKELSEKLEHAFVIPPQLKRDRNDLLLDYLWISSKQQMLRKEMLKSGIEERDAIYIVPRNTRVRTLETYDLVNLIDLELPLRLCRTCEPERYATSELKEKAIKEKISELNTILGVKCNLGYCPELEYCDKMLDFNPNYNKEIHTAIRKILIEKVKRNLPEKIGV